MKHSVVFLLILISSLLSKVIACGPYYPFGDDIRFVLLKPGTFNYPDFIEFSYTADLFYSANFNNDFSSTKDSIDENIRLWRKRCNNVPDENDTYEAIYVLDDQIKESGYSNLFINYLQKNKDFEAIKYLNFAKKCSPYNSVIADPWERNEHANLSQRTELINYALNMAKSLTDEDLQLRYAFLAIRLAYYNDDFEKIKDIYNQYFVNHKSNNIIDYWSMYFMIFAETDRVKRNYYASQVFYSAPDKRKNIFYYYDKNIPIEETFKFAKSLNEKVAIWIMSGFRKTGKSIEILKSIYSLKPNVQGLSFLLLREVNKIEDWIYTPYYTRFTPSLEPWDYEVKSYPENRIQEDRIYAKELLKFVNAADLNKVENPILWNIVKAYLNYITQNYETSLNELNQLQKSQRKDSKLIRQINILKALCINAKQDGAEIQNEVKSVIMHEFALGNNKFLFAIARELEYKGNTNDAAILLSKLRARVDKDNEGGYWRNGIYWRTKANHFTLFVDYYDDYFFYLDAQYSIKQLNDLITDVKNTKYNDAFSNWKYSVIKKDVSRLYDLLGTKYLRVNDLNTAFNNYQLVNDTLWNSQEFPYRIYLDANPFYTNMFNEHKKSVADTVQFNKLEIISRLIDYLNKANNIKSKDRDYYYFLAANCYFNMTQYGNSWMMKRYYWTSSMHKTNLEDDDEYFNCNLAQQYYLKAKEVTQSKKFAALCLRMAGRCEGYRTNRNIFENQSASNENIYYKNLEDDYLDYYDDLMGNCESFDSYFNSR